MKKGYLLLPLLIITQLGNTQLTIQSGATLFIETGAKVTVQGDLVSSANILGPGTIVMKGSSLQNIAMNGFQIPNLEIDNAANVSLTGGVTKIASNLLFTNGKLLIGSQDLVIAPSATITGNTAARFIWTDGIGQVKKELTADINNYEIPLGIGTTYRPAYLTVTGGTYASATIGVRVVSGASANKPPMIANYLSTFWPVSKTGITGGTQTITGQYIDGDISGSEASLAGYYFNGTDWSSLNETHNAATNRVAMPITSAGGELSGMNKFIAVGTRAFLQGAYNSSTGLMSDALRTGGNVILVNDPYRTAPYNTSFTHVANAKAEIVSASVFNNQASASDDIVDWVFLELRNTTSPGNVVLQTRSALIQRDGDIIDIDGTSPVTFNNVTAGNYIVAVRHRNHLGLSLLPSSPKAFSEARSLAFASNVADLRSTASSLFGTEGLNYTTASHPSLTTVNLLWSGNINANGSSNYSGPNNDRLVLLTDLSGNQITTLSGYRRGDLNMNKTVSYSGPGNDRLFLLSNVLNGNQITSRSQALPN